jgi:two-component system cell cycle response regulator DivK
VSDRKILVVEDHALNMELVVDVLEAAGYAVLEARNAEDGLAIARSESPDVILMDVGLPEIDGLTATRALKADPATRSNPVVALTSHAMKGDRERIMAAGCTDHITKPIDTRSLARTVEAIIRRAGGREVQASGSPS